MAAIIALSETPLCCLLVITIISAALPISLVWYALMNHDQGNQGNSVDGVDDDGVGGIGGNRVIKAMTAMV